ncbi:hypothetical protein EYF80_021923 [Liparis tanakae]|uniref:Uncharacterized protein n=1 Tax=Liparis tanakae TaxID=230148 RepID=A0A4Z2HSH3_9TELE|nr:hypothetical protein EYF80_021923 [Liparis tanakae]
MVLVAGLTNTSREFSEAGVRTAAGTTACLTAHPSPETTCHRGARGDVSGVGNVLSGGEKEEDRRQKKVERVLVWEEEEEEEEGDNKCRGAFKNHRPDRSVLSSAPVRQERSAAPNPNNGGVFGAHGERSSIRDSRHRVGSERVLKRFSGDIKLGCSTASRRSLTGDSLRKQATIKAKQTVT